MTPPTQGEINAELDVDGLAGLLSSMQQGNTRGQINSYFDAPAVAHAMRMTSGGFSDQNLAYCRVPGDDNQCCSAER